MRKTSFVVVGASCCSLTFGEIVLRTSARLSPATRTASGGPTARTSATRIIPRSTRSTRSNFNKLHGRLDASRPTISVRGRSTSSKELRSWSMASCIRRPERGAPSSRWTPATGELLWTHSEREGPRGAAAPRQLSGRGLAYWTDGREERILYVTPGYRLIALNAKTGMPVPTFGQNGVVDLKLDDDQEIDLINGEVGLHATPVVAKDVVIVGAAHKSGGVPRSKKNVKGYVRGFDVQNRKASLDLPHDSALRTNMDTKPGKTIRPRTPATPASGDRSASMKNSRRSTFPSNCRPVTTTAAIVRETACSAKASSPWIFTPASESGITSWFITASGTWTFRARPSLSTSRSTGARSKPSRNRPSRHSCMCSIASLENRSGRSRSGLSNNRRCPAKRRARRSRFRPSRRRTIGRALPSTT